MIWLFYGMAIGAVISTAHTIVHCTYRNWQCRQMWNQTDFHVGLLKAGQTSWHRYGSDENYQRIMRDAKRHRDMSNREKNNADPDKS